MTRLTRFGYPARVTVGLVLILLFALISAVQSLRSAIAMAPWRNAVTAYDGRAATARGDDVSVYESRFEELKRVLPSHEAVGYISEPRGYDPRPQVYHYRYVLTQYALSPVVVMDSTKPRLVVGNFHATGFDRRACARDLTLLHDFGNGVMLFANNVR